MNDKDNNSLVLNGPGFFDLACYSRKSAADYNYLFNDKTNKITFAKYTPHAKIQSNVRGYGNYTCLRGDLHCHTLWSDAYYGGTPGYIDDPFNTFRIYQGLGHDFVGISDHTFGLDSNKDTYDQRYDGKHTDGNPRGVKYAMSHSEWLKTVKHSNRADHNYNFTSLAGVEMSYGGAAIDIAHNSPDEIAHFNAFGYDDLYYGQPGKWENTATSRNDVYRWAAETYKTNPTLVMQFNHPSNEGKGFNYFIESEAKDANGNLYNRDPFRLCEFFTISKKGQYRNYFRAYKKALAQGWKVAPTATSDNHDEIHELKTIYKNIRTVVVSENQSKESILNAMIARRVYATRIPKLNLFYSLTNSNNENVVMLSLIHI